ncbi:MAG TPA: choice-of-anchor Q domain-containing protein [Verrucomicrobiae bacterium]|nr:choice-of-anchor Q domain-containing protein [Verrucomicrobiae bacterium]
MLPERFIFNSTAFDKIAFLVLVFAISLATHVARAQSNLVLLVSHPGDYVGQGQTYLTTNLSDFSAGFGSQKDIQVSAFGYVLFYGGPGGANLAVGTYTNASRWPGNGSAPGLSVFGNGRACDSVCGNFTILELHSDTSGNLDRLWLTFTQNCECSEAPMTGEIRYHSQLAPAAPTATVRHVPSDYPTIQEAIDASSILAVDTVLVAPGTYYESVQFNGKSVNLTTEAGPSQTFLIAPGGTAISFANGESPSASVSGFTITNCNTGISVSRGGAPTIVSNVIINCGGGINCDSGDSDIEASPLIHGNRIIGCSGAAVSLSFTGTPQVEDNLMEGNGGGVGMWEAGSPTIYNNVIRDNFGDGLNMVNYSDANIIQNAIVRNNGDGIYALVPENARGPWIIGNTIAGNAGVGFDDDGYGGNDIEVFNNIFAGNPALSGVDGDFEFNDFYPLDATSGNLVGTAGNIAADPLFVYPLNNDFHLLTGSPCINAGTNSYAYTNVDVSGNARIAYGAIDMGAYEFQAEHYVNANNANPVSPYTNWANAATTIQDAVNAASPGDPILVTNGTYQTGGQSVHSSANRVAITKALGVFSVNGAVGTVIQGNSPVGDSAVRCAYLAADAELVGFTLTNGATANQGDANEDQSGGGAWCESADAMLANCVLSGNAANVSGGGVYQGTLLNSTLTGNTAENGGGAADCVMTNCDLSLNTASLSGGGVYGGTLSQCLLTNNTVNNPPVYWTTSGGGAYGSTLNNCLVVTNSASGGGGAEQCIANNSDMIDNNALWGGGADNSQLTNCNVTANSAQSGAGAYDSSLAGCTLGGNFGQYGGGAEYCTLNRCILATNITYDDEVYGLGGGADSSTLNNCLVYGNVSSTSAGVSASTVENCTIVGNTTTQAGGAVDTSTLYNSIVYDNVAPGGTNCSNSTLTNCCTAPLPETGMDNIALDPEFVDATANNFRLQANSPCINSGRNAYVPTGTDLDGNPRIKGGTVDIGAYEYQTPLSVISYGWLQQYGLPTDGSVDDSKLDGTGFTVYQDWIAGLNPTNPASVLAMVSPSATNNTTAGVTVIWQSVDDRTYYLQRGTNLLKRPVFSTIQSNLVGQAGSTIYTDTTATNSGPYYYRVDVQ